eukprot:1192426-Prorocentrum_minimum.AAC.2
MESTLTQGFCHLSDTEDHHPSYDAKLRVVIHVLNLCRQTVGYRTLNARAVRVKLVNERCYIRMHEPYGYRVDVAATFLRCRLFPSGAMTPGGRRIVGRREPRFLPYLVPAAKRGTVD